MLPFFPVVRMYIVLLYAVLLYAEASIAHGVDARRYLQATCRQPEASHFRIASTGAESCANSVRTLNVDLALNYANTMLLPNGMQCDGLIHTHGPI